MDSFQIINALKANEKELIFFYKEQSSDFWEVTPATKWSAGQHVIHLVQSTKPLVRALKLPYFVLKWKFGTSNRPSRNYDEVISKYHEKLGKAQGIISPFSSNMPDSPANEMNQWLAKLSLLNTQLNKITEKISDKHFDTVLIPHPLMGKMTLREILMWNTYHTKHHFNILNEKYLNIQKNQL